MVRISIFQTQIHQCDTDHTNNIQTTLEAATVMNAVQDFHNPSPIVYCLHRRKLYNSLLLITPTMGITGKDTTITHPISNLYTCFIALLILFKYDYETAIKKRIRASLIRYRIYFEYELLTMNIEYELEEGNFNFLNRLI